jgi:L-cystine uptake protein TcyP (sodium:dicarboxylate symporter family)
MLLGTIVGVAVGLVIHFGLITSDPVGIHTAATWAAFPGDLWLRVLKCIDLPLIAANVMVGVQVGFNILMRG